MLRLLIPAVGTLNVVIALWFFFQIWVDHFLKKLMILDWQLALFCGLVCSINAYVAAVAEALLNRFEKDTQERHDADEVDLLRNEGYL